MACPDFALCWFPVLRVYNRPPRYDESLAFIASDLMPLSLLLHLAFGLWMYSAPNTVPAVSCSWLWLIHRLHPRWFGH